MTKSKSSKSNLLRDTRVYLSGPMDFVASRVVEKKQGWRNRVGQFLRHNGATVFDPWNKPIVRGLWEYGVEDVKSADARDKWTFEPSEDGARNRAECAATFWETLHIDLRMVDISDFIIAYCPTNVYSVGTPHEIVLARQQRKPVLFISPPITHDSFSELKKHLHERDDIDGLDLLARVEWDTPVKPNPKGIPSLWYMPLIDTELFFDGFGFDSDEMRREHGWTEDTPLDLREKEHPPTRPLLLFLQGLACGRVPQTWDRKLDRYRESDDWLLLENSLADDDS